MISNSVICSFGKNFESHNLPIYDACQTQLEEVLALLWEHTCQDDSNTTPQLAYRWIRDGHAENWGWLIGTHFGRLPWMDMPLFATSCHRCSGRAGAVIPMRPGPDNHLYCRTTVTTDLWFSKFRAKIGQPIKFQWIWHFMILTGVATLRRQVVSILNILRWHTDMINATRTDRQI